MGPGKPRKGEKVAVFSRLENGGAAVALLMSKKVNPVRVLTSAQEDLKKEKTPENIKRFQGALSMLKVLREKGIATDKLRTFKGAGCRVLVLTFTPHVAKNGAKVLKLLMEPGEKTINGCKRAVSAFGVISKHAKSFGISKPQNSSWACNVAEYMRAIEEAGWEIRVPVAGLPALFFRDGVSNPWASFAESYKGARREPKAPDETAGEKTSEPVKVKRASADDIIAAATALDASLAASVEASAGETASAASLAPSDVVASNEPA